MRDESGLALLYTVLLLPTVLILVALVLEVGALRVHRARLQSAADIAASAAVTEQDRTALAADGRYRIAPEGVDVARAMLIAGIEPLSGALAPGTTAEAVARSAEIAILESGSRDAATNRLHHTPTIRIRFRAPVRTPLLLLASLRDTTTVTIVAAASAR
jgi:Flp pilus assembly protein TadG